MVLTPTSLVANEVRVFTRAEAIAVGHSDHQLRRWVSGGSVRRVSRGAFAVGPAPEYAEGRLIERAKAFALPHGDRVALSHHVALVLHGIATYAVPLHIVYAVRISGGAQLGAGVHLERPRTAPPTVLVDGVNVVRAEVAVVQVARTFGHVAGCVAADSALSLQTLDRADLRREAERVGAAPGIAVARAIVDLCRDGSAHRRN